MLDKILFWVVLVWMVALLVMAITEGLRPAAKRALARAQQQPVVRKQNVPPFKGGTCHYLMLGTTAVNAARKASRNAESVVLR